MPNDEEPFSQKIEKWLKSNQPKTFDNLQEVFGEKSLAIFVLLLMFWPALPLPTGGLTHVFEVIAMIIAIQMMFGVQEIWIPKKWRNKQLGQKTTQKALPFMIRRIKWFERFSRPRLNNWVNNSVFLRLAGLMILIFAVAAFSSPPFSGLDTLPALGAVIIALSLILDDMLIFLIGCLVGIFGVSLSLTLGAAVVTIFQHLWENLKP